MNQETNIILRNAFKLAPSEAERFSDMISRAMFKESTNLRFAGYEKGTLPLICSEARRQEIHRQNREQMLVHLSPKFFRSTIEISNLSGLTRSHVNKVMNKLKKQRRVEHITAGGLAYWKLVETEGENQ